MNDTEPGQQPGETIGIASGLDISDLDRPSEEPGAARKAVLFVSEDVNPEDILNGVEVVRVDEDVILDQVRRRTRRIWPTRPIYARRRQLGCHRVGHGAHDPQ